jgi:hypothetical protein
MTTKQNITEVTNNFKNLFTSNKTKNIYSSKLEAKSAKSTVIKKINENQNTKTTNKEKINEEKINNEKINNEKIDYDIRKNLALNIKKLEEYEKIQIFHIIKNSGESYSQNRRGVLFDLLKFKDSTIENLNKFIKSTTAYRK